MLVLGEVYDLLAPKRPLTTKINGVKMLKLGILRDFA